MTSLVIHLALTGQSQVKAGLRDAAGEGKRLGNSLEQAGEEGARGLQRVSSIAGGLSVSFKKVSQDGEQAGEAISQGADKAGDALDKTKHRSVEMGRAIWKAAHEGIEGFTGLDLSVRGVGRSLQALDQKWESTKRKVGMGMVAGSIATGLVLGGNAKAAGHQESQLKAISALTRSDSTAKATFDTVDQMAGESVFNLDDLVKSGKSLTKAGIFSRRLQQAADDLAAANFDEGANPTDVTRVYGRLKSQDWGEAFERLRDFGISRSDIEAQGGRFDGGGSYQGTSEEAIEQVTRVIEKKFNGLSKKLATETLEGSLSNLDDATTRLKVSIGQELVPTITLGVRMINGVVNAFNALPRPFKFCIAWGGVLAGSLMALGGVALLVGGTIVKVAMMWRLASIAIQGLNVIAGLAGTSVWALASSLLTRLIPSLFGAQIAALGVAATVVGAMALITVAAYGFSAAISGVGAASSQSASELKKHWSGLGSFWVAAGDAMNKILNSPLFRVLFAPQFAAAKALGLTSDTSGGDDADQKNYQMDVAKWRRQGKRIKSFEEWSGGDPNSEEYIEPAPRPAAPIAPTPIAAGGVPGGASTAPAIPGGMALPGSAPTNDIERLEDLLAATEDKETRKQLREQLRLARRTQRHANQFEREENKRESAEERAQKQATRLADRQAGIDADVAEAQLNASLQTKLAAMKRAGASKGAMQQVKAQAELERARIRARGEGSDTIGASRALRLGEARAAGLGDLSEYADDENGTGRGVSNQRHLNSMLSILRRGGSLFDLNRNGGTGAEGASSGGSGSGAGGTGGSDTRTLTARVVSNVYSQVAHSWNIKFEPLVVKDPYGRDAAML